MRVLTSLALAAGLMLSACMEKQAAPDLPSQTKDQFNIEILANDLANPWAVTELPDGSFLITERGGKLFQLSGDQKTEITGLPKDIYVAGQAGLFDVVLSPDFENSTEIYLAYAYGTDANNGTAVLRATLEGTSLTNQAVIFRTSPPKDTSAHFGGRIAFLPDGTFVLSTGEGFKYREESQNLNSHFGKMIRLGPDGGVPEDNPKLGDKPQIYSFGHRNPQGLTYDVVTGNLWSHEHGPRGGDELNLIRPGANYGWPVATKGVDYNGARISPYESYVGMEDAVHIWTPSIAPSGLAIYRGELFADWNGDALIGGLASGDLRRVDLDGARSVGEEVLLSDLEARVRDVRVSKDGAILLIIDGKNDGALLRVTPKK